MTRLIQMSDKFAKEMAAEEEKYSMPGVLAAGALVRAPQNPELQLELTMMTKKNDIDTCIKCGKESDYGCHGMKDGQVHSEHFCAKHYFQTKGK